MAVRLVTGALAIALAVLTAPTAAADDPAPPPVADPATAPLSVPATPPDGIPHLPSPDNLPPGTTDAQDAPQQSRTLNYLKDLFHAVRTQDVTMGDALLLFAQRPMDSKAPLQAMTPRTATDPADPAVPVPLPDAAPPAESPAAEGPAAQTH